MTAVVAERLMGSVLELEGNRALFRGLRRDLEAAGRSPATVAAYNQGCLSLERWLTAHGHGGDLAAVDRDLAAAWLTWCQAPAPEGGGYAKDSVVSYYRSVRRFYNFLVEDEVIEKSPLARIPIPSGSGKPKEFPTVDEMRAVLRTCKPARGKPTYDDLRDEFVMRLFAEAGGPRAAEVAYCRSGALDLSVDVIQLHGKGDKWRTIPLSQLAAKAGDRYLRARKDHLFAHLDRLVLGAAGEMTPSGLRQMMERRCEQAGVRRLTPHMWRHAAASRCKEAGMADGDMMRLFGWSSTTMLHHYGSAQADRRAVEAARRLNLGNEL